MPEDLSQYLKSLPPSFLPDYSAYFTNNLPTTGGYNNSSGSSNDWMRTALDPIKGVGDPFGVGEKVLGFNPLEKILDPLGIGDKIFGGIFGKDKPSWKPYLDKDGNWVWNNPQKYNPVPLTNVPGAPLSPNKTYKKLAGDVSAIYDLFPYFTETANKSATNSALNDLEISKLTSGPYTQLMVDLYNQYGPQLNAIGNEISKRNAISQSQTDKEVLTGAGTDLVKAADKLQREQDPEYYATRANTADSISKLLSSIDLSGGLSNTERDEIQKGLAIEGVNRGTVNAPSNLETVANAMQYGQAGRNRILQNQNALTAAINASTQFIPSSKSGVDVFQVATGRSSVPNTGNNLFTGVQKADSSNAYGLAGQLLGSANNLTTNQMQIDANKKDSLDKFSQITSGLANIGSLAGGFI